MRTLPINRPTIPTGAEPPDPALADKPVRVGAEWLALREEADARARSTELADRLSALLRRRTGDAGRAMEIHDLGAGTGSMARWLAPRLSGPQRWVLHDRDQDLLDAAARATITGRSDVAIDASIGDVTALAPGTLDRADLVTASALLDLFTLPELDGVIAAWRPLGCPLLVALTVTGRVRLDPADPLDAAVARAFNAHQRRPARGAGLLGPVAVPTAIRRLSASGAIVRTRAAPWRLGSADRPLIVPWLRGWIAAAMEQRPDLRTVAAGYLDRRLEQAAMGTLRVVVQHQDLLAVPAIGFPELLDGQHLSSDPAVGSRP